MTKRKSRRKNSQRRVVSHEYNNHARSIAQSVGSQVAIFAGLLDSASPAADLEKEMTVELARLRKSLAPHRPERVIELSRLACLPWSFAGLTKPDTEGGFTRSELLTLLATTMSVGKSDGSSIDEIPNELYREAHDWADSAGRLIELAQVRELLSLRSRQANELDFIAHSSRSREVWIRGTSYADMLASTYRSLFGKVEVRKALSEKLGFTADEAYDVLTCLHDLQVSGMNDRIATAMDAMRALAEAGKGSVIEPTVMQNATFQFNRGWQPTADLIAIHPAQISEQLGVDEKRVQNVLSRFSLSLGKRTARQLLDGFVAGDNPLRTQPVFRTDRGEYILVHEALLLPAIRENLEQELKSFDEWEIYQKWRGNLLEELGQKAFRKIIPTATTYASFEYFVPVNDGEHKAGPERYTKRVEGDILLVLDDVAIIVEAKAVAITPESRSGDTRRLRRDLTGIITKASTQAARLKERIEDDGGIRLNKTGWIDLSRVREIHTVALSLEDLAGVSTATSELVAAGVLDAESIPWVVSIHDLQIIADLVERPAEFLLYLRRRRDPEVSLVYVAPDELDLFLYFYEAGLYIAPDPSRTARDLPHVPPPSTRDVRRRKQQTRTIISTRTDALDAWHYARTNADLPKVPKPVLSGSPAQVLADDLQKLGNFGWLSIGATLISGETKAQRKILRIPSRLLRATRADGKEHSQGISLGTNLSNAWLIVWITRPADVEYSEAIRSAGQYLKVKKYQLRFNRGAALVYDEATNNLLEVIYDGTPFQSDPAMESATQGLFPTDRASTATPRRPGPSKKSRRRKKRKRQ